MKNILTINDLSLIYKALGVLESIITLTRAFSMLDVFNIKAQCFETRNKVWTMMVELEQQKTK